MKSRTLSRSVCALSVLLVSLSNVAATAQDDPTIPYPIKGQIVIDPEIMQIDIPTGDVRLPGEIDRVVTHDEDNRRVVAKVHATVDDNFVLLLPDGRLVGRMREDVEATQKEFVPATHTEIAEAIMEEHGLKGYRVEKTEHFVLIYNTSPEFAKLTTKMMESMLAGVTEYATEQGIKTHAPEIPLPVLAFHEVDDFQSYKPMRSEVAAYYEIQSNRVILKEESLLDMLGLDDLAAKERVSTIAHEGCHQLLHNIGVQQRLSRWPMWLGEGIAEYMAPTESGKKYGWKGAGMINDMRMYELEIFLQKQFVKGFNGDTVDQTVRAGVLDSTGYSAAWTLTHYLAKEHKTDFDRYMQYLSRMAPLHGMLPEGVDLKEIKVAEDAIVKVNMDHFNAFFADDIEKFENDLVKFMRADSNNKYESPMANYPHWAGLCIVPGLDEKKRFACFFLQEGDVVEWMAQLKETLSEYEKEHAEVYVRQYPNRGTANTDITKFMKGKLDPGKGRRRR